MTWLACLVCLVAQAEGANWPHFGRDAKHSRETVEHLGMPLTPRWTFNAGAPIVSSPTTAKGLVFVGARTNKIYALEAATGVKRWEFETGGWVDASPTVAQTLVYVSSRDGFLYVLEAETGMLKWKYATGGANTASPLVENDVVYVSCGFPHKCIYALSAFDGSLKWKVDVGQFVYSSPSIEGGMLCVGANDGKFYGLDPSTGEIKWQYGTKGRIYFSSPLIENNTVYGASGEFDRDLHAFDVVTGQLRWKRAIADSSFNAAKVSSPAMGSDGVLFVAAGNLGDQLVVSALRATDGQIVWQTKAPNLTALGTVPDFEFISSPALTPDYVLMGSGNGKLFVVNRTTGVIVEQHALSGSAVSSPTVSNGWVYVGTLGGVLHGFQANEIVTITSPEFKETKNQRTLTIHGVMNAGGVDGYAVSYGAGLAPSTWVTLQSGAASSSTSNQTLTVWKVSANVTDGVYTIQLQANTSGGLKAARVPFILASILISANITASQGGTLTASDGTQVIIPPGGLSRDDTLTIRGPGFFTFTVPDQGIPANVTATGVTREFTFGNSATTLTKWATITIPFTDSEVLGRTVEGLRLYVWDPAKTIWKVVHTSFPSVAAKTISASVSHFSMFRAMEFSPSDDLLQEETVYTYPNPATGNSVTFKFLLGDTSDILINVYSVAGNRIAELSGSGLGGTAAEITWNTDGIASGVYIYRLEARSRRTGAVETITKKLAIVK